MHYQIRRHWHPNWFQTALFLCIFFTAAVFAAMITPVSANAEDGVSIVTIDLQKVFQAHPAFNEARQEIQKEVEAKKKELEAMGESNRQMAQQQMQQQLQQTNRELQEEAFRKVRADIRKIAEQQGYEYVVDKKMLIVGGKDVTREVMNALDLEADSKDDKS